MLHSIWSIASTRGSNQGLLCMLPLIQELIGMLLCLGLHNMLAQMLAQY